MESDTHRKQSGKTLRVGTRWIVIGGVAASALILVLLFINLLTEYTTSQRQLARQYQVVPVADGVTLEVIYPRQLLLNADPAALVVGLRVGKAAVFTLPLTITLDTPPSIAISNTIQGKHVFIEGNGAPAKFGLANTAVLPLSRYQTITLTHSLITTPTLLTINTEAPQTTAWRQFILGTVSDKSPLLITLAALLPIAALILQYVQKQEERETTERQRLIDQQKKDLYRQVKQLRRYLIQTNCDGIRYAWKQINQPPLQRTLPFRDRKWLERLVNLAVSNEIEQDKEAEAKEWIIAVQNEWTAELIGALVLAEGAVIANPSFYKPIFQHIPLDKVTDFSLRNQFIRLWDKIERIQLQNRTEDIKPSPDKPQESPLAESELRHILERDPFLHTQAEEEETSLLEQRGFWFLYPVYNAVANATRLQVVYGPAGCGRTALAKNLCYHGSRSFFWHYQQLHENLTDTFGLRFALAQHLIDYISSKPTLLQPVQENQRRLLADILVGVLTRRSLLAQLEAARASVAWIRPDMSVQQRDIWQQVGDTQMALLAQAVEATPNTIRLTDLQWVNGLVRSFSLFGFSGVRLLLDCTPDAAESIMSRLPVFQEWQRFGLISTLFTPGSDVNISGTPSLALTWTQEQLTALFEHRLLWLAKGSPSVLFLTESVYNSFMEIVTAETTVPLPPTPRKLAQMWRIILASTINKEAKEVIDQAAVEIATHHMRQQIIQVQTVMPAQKINPKDLSEKMDAAFSDDELRRLCKDIDVDYDNLPGRAKIDKIHELISFLERQERLPVLLARCRQLRPNIDWS